MSSWNDNPLGRSRVLFSNPYIEVIEEEILAGRQSEVLYHMHKLVDLCVISGQLKFEVDAPPYSPSGEHPHKSDIRIFSAGGRTGCNSRVAYRLTAYANQDLHLIKTFHRGRKPTPLLSSSDVFSFPSFHDALTQLNDVEKNLSSLMEGVELLPTSERGLSPLEV